MTPTPQPWNPYYDTDVRALELRLTGVSYDDIAALLGITADDAASAATLVATDAEYELLHSLDHPASSPLIPATTPSKDNTTMTIQTGTNEALALHKRAQQVLAEYQQFAATEKTLGETYTQDVVLQKMTEARQPMNDLIPEMTAWREKFDKATREQLNATIGVHDTDVQTAILTELRAAREWNGITARLNSASSASTRLAAVSDIIPTLPAATFEHHAESLTAYMRGVGDMAPSDALHARRMQVNPDYAAAHKARTDYETTVVALDSTAHYLRQAVESSSAFAAELVNRPFGQHGQDA